MISADDQVALRDQVLALMGTSVGVSREVGAHKTFKHHSPKDKVGFEWPEQLLYWSDYRAVGS